MNTSQQCLKITVLQGFTFSDRRPSNVLDAGIAIAIPSVRPLSQDREWPRRRALSQRKLIYCYIDTSKEAKLITRHVQQNTTGWPQKNCTFVSRWNLLMNNVGKQLNSVNHTKLYWSVYKQCSICPPLSQKLHNSVEISQSYINLTSSKQKCAVFWTTLYSWANHWCF